MSSYRGISKSDALARLTGNVREQLAREGLGGVFFEAHDVDPVGGVLAVRLTVEIPDSLPPNQWLRAQQISGEECAKFLRERYSA